jgi:hypothetical protein
MRIWWNRGRREEPHRGRPWLLARFAERCGERARKIPVDEEPRHGSADYPHLVGCKHLCRVRKRREHVVAHDPVFARNLIGG